MVQTDLLFIRKSGLVADQTGLHAERQQDITALDPILADDLIGH